MQLLYLDDMKVAKLVIIDDKGQYLLLHRSDHPTFGTDPDLPGGTVEDGESSLQAMVREVDEEAGIVITETDAQLLYEGTAYSRHNTHYSLYKVTLKNRPDVVVSWEHSSYEWLDHKTFLQKSKNANDSFMHMVHDMVK